MQMMSAASSAGGSGDPIASSEASSEPIVEGTAREEGEGEEAGERRSRR